MNVDYAVDSQISEKGREVRLIRTLLQTGNSKGIGVDANTALVVTNPLSSPVGLASLSYLIGLFNHFD